MKIIFVRHGHPDYSTDSLTEEGHKQAEAAAARLAEAGITRIVSSTSGRAYQTAEHTAKRLGLPIEAYDFMREVGWNTPNATDEEKAYFHPWRAGERLQKEYGSLLLPDYDTLDVWHDRPIEAHCRRVITGFDEWMAKMGYQREGAGYRAVAPNDEVVALFSHGGSSTVVMAHLLGLPPFFMFGHCPLAFTAFSAFTFTGAPGERIFIKCGSFNDAYHIAHPIPNVFGE